MSRFKAAGIHLLISLIVVGLIAAFYLTQWYPPELLEMSRGVQLLGILALVDVVIGPLLTLIVFKPGKKSLKFDLSVIAVLQIAAMAYGLHTMWKTRPVFLVAVKDRIELVFASEIDPNDLAKAKPEYHSLTWAKPRLVSAPTPNDPKIREEILLASLNGKDIQLRPEFYRPYADIKSTLVANIQPTSALNDNRQYVEQKAQRLSKTKDIDVSQIGFVPLNSARGAAIMLMNRQTAETLGPINADPWATK
jgi:hypothetical protein